MPKELPFYPLYVRDFDEDKHVLAMSLAEVGLYFLSLNEAWKRGGVLDDPRALAIAIRKDPKEVKEAWAVVKPRFVVKADTGWLVNPRQEKERQRAIEKSQKARESVQVRYNKQRERLSALPPVEAAEPSTTATAPVSAPQVTPSGRYNWKKDVEFMGQFVDAYTSTGAQAIESDWVKAYMMWKRLDFEQKNSAVTHVRTCDPAHIKLPQNYLNDQEWTRAPRPEPRLNLEKIMESV